MEYQRLEVQTKVGYGTSVVAHRSLEYIMAESMIEKLKSYSSESGMRTEMMELTDSMLEELIRQCENSFILSKKRKLIPIAKGILKERQESTKVTEVNEVSAVTQQAIQSAVSKVASDVKVNLLIEKVPIVSGQQICALSTCYYAIPHDLAVAIAEQTPWGRSEGMSYATDDEILRYYILEASKSFFAADMLIMMVEKTIKKLLCLDVLPIPSATTVYLFVVWSNMIAELSKKHYKYSDISKKKEMVVALSISILAMLIQIINRETPLTYVKLVYSGPVQAKDFVARMPQDIKVWVKSVLGNNTSIFGQTLDKALNNRFITWNNILEELTGVKNLSMNKAMDMLYTYRIGNSFLEYANNGKMFDVFDLSGVWKQYGPLPDMRQMDGMFELFRNIPGEYGRKKDAIYDNHVLSIRNSKNYYEIINYCWNVYKALNWLDLSYNPTSFGMSVLFEPIPKINYKHVSDIATWAMNNNANNVLYGIKKETIEDEILKYVNDKNNQIFAGL